MTIHNEPNEEGQNGDFQAGQELSSGASFPSPKFEQRKKSAEELFIAGADQTFPRPSIGAAIALCHDHKDEIVFGHNYMSATGDAKSLFPFHLTPYPELDFPTSYLAVANCGKGETILTFKLPDGMKEYFKSKGLIDESNTIIEVVATPGPDGQVGFPYTDIVTLALAQKPEALKDKSVALTFPSPYVAAQLEHTGANPLQTGDAYESSHKAALHEASEKYGFQMAKWQAIESAADVGKIAENFKDSQRIWLKLAHGAGGDNVVPIDAPFTKEKIEAEIVGLKKATKDCFDAHNYGMGGLENYWPEEDYAPTKSVLFVEADASDLGKPVANLSNTVFVHKDGKVSTEAYYKQFTGEDGEFHGGEPVQLDDSVAQKFEEQMQAIGKYYHELGFKGMIGVDLFAVETPSGEVEPMIIEVNGRPSSNANTQIVASKLELPYWINATLNYKEPLSTMDEVLEVIKEAGCAEKGQGFEVVPLCMGCLVDEDGKASYESGKVRFLIGSTESRANCHEALSKLKQSGFTV